MRNPNSKYRISCAMRYIKLVGIGRSSRNIKKAKRLFSLTDNDVSELQLIIKTERIPE